MSILKTCVNCGKEFSVPLCRSNTARFCSTKCKNEKKDWAKTKVWRTCLTCGKQFETWAAWVRKGTGFFCSTGCIRPRKGEKTYWKAKSNKYDVDTNCLIADYQSGLGGPELSAKYGIDRATLINYLKRAGIKLRSNKEAQKLRAKQGKSTGANSATWKGGRKVTKHGYIEIYMPDHPRANSKNYVREHIAIWMEANGHIPKGYVVHHLNGIKDDNRLENLLVMENGEHSKRHGREPYKKKIRELEQEIILLKQQLI